MGTPKLMSHPDCIPDSVELSGITKFGSILDFAIGKGGCQEKDVRDASPEILLRISRRAIPT